MEFPPHAIAYLDISGSSDFVEEADKPENNDKLELLVQMFILSKASEMPFYTGISHGV